MNQEFNCDCAERYPIEIDSWKLFQELKSFFEKQVENRIFDDVPVEEPFHTWRSGDRVVKWFADKWYRCSICGCLWEFRYPDFPASGDVRKFADGKYHDDAERIIKK